MAGQLHPTRVPSATNTARARGTDIAEFAARTYGYQGSSSWGQLRAGALVLDGQVKSPLKIGAAITSPRGRS
jgi:hypothetical protein